MADSPPGPRNMKTFLIIWLGELISMVGSGLTSFALAVWIFERTGQATPFAIAVLFGNLPRILLSPVAGS
jgi:MFS transporter, DHA3 family, macrolide efflux protein